MKANRVTVYISVMLATGLTLAACGGGNPVSLASSGNTTNPNQDSGSSAVQLNASGSTFIQPALEDWAYTYSQAHPSVTINYSGVGSGQGIKDIEAGNVDFAGSDALLQPSDYQAHPDLQMLPMLAGAVVLAYNVKGVNTPITLNANVVAGIYMGKITNWNDPAIAALNPGIKFPDTPINVVHRSDGSGTTNIFTLYLSAVSSEWKNGPGAGMTVQWPADKLGRGQGGKGNPGVSAAIQNTNGAIGYVELAYAMENKILFANMINAAGKTVSATIPSTVSAIGSAQLSDRLTATFVNASDPAAWPIAGFTYLIVNKSYTNCAKADALASFVNWDLTNSEAITHANTLFYATLPDAARSKVLDAVKAITCNGKPVTINP